MTRFAAYVAPMVLLAAFSLGGCSPSGTQSPDVTDAVRKSIAAAGLKDVSVSQDRAKGVVTLGGHVISENEKTLAESTARPLVGSQVLAMEIAVVPVGVEKEAKNINSDVDKGIEANLNAALISSKLHAFVKYEVTNAVVTLSGEVASQAVREQAEKVAAAVPYVKQVVNTLQVKGQKATSTV